MIFEFRFRHGVRGVQTAHLESESLAAATAKARLYVSRQPGALFIENSPAPWLIEVSEESATVEEPALVVHKPELPEQRQRLKALASERMAGTGVGSAPKADGRIGA